MPLGLFICLEEWAEDPLEMVLAQDHSAVPYEEDNLLYLPFQPQDYFAFGIGEFDRVVDQSMENHDQGSFIPGDGTGFFGEREGQGQTPLLYFLLDSGLDSIDNLLDGNRLWKRDMFELLYFYKQEHVFYQTLCFEELIVEVG